jgi:hypothetical protein
MNRLEWDAEFMKGVVPIEKLLGTLWYFKISRPAR